VPYDTFESYSTFAANCSKLGSLHLEYVQLDPNALVESLKGCTELQSITLKNVEFIRPISPVSNLLLPKLTEFCLIMYHITAKSAAEFMTYLFFYNSTGQDLIPNTVNILVEVKLNDARLEYYPSAQALINQNLGFDVSRYFEYNAIMFIHGFFDPVTLKVENLTSLTLMRLVNFNPYSTLYDKLKLARNLVEFTLTISELDFNESVNVSIDLSIFPSIETLQFLTLENVHIWSSKWVELKGLKFFHVWPGVLNLTALSISNSLSMVDLKNVVFIGNRLDTFLAKMTNLTELSLDLTEMENQKLDMLSLENSANSLREMRLFGLQLEISSQNLTFDELSHIRFKKCNFMENVLNRFSSTFLGLIEVEMTQSNLSLPFLQEVLSISSLREFEIQKKTLEVPTMLKFLLDSGVPVNANGANLHRNETSPTGWSAYLIHRVNNRHNTVLRDVTLYGYCILLVGVGALGILGNILSAVVLSRKNMRSSTSCLLLGLTFCDMSVLMTYICSALYFGIKLVLVFLQFKISVNNEYSILGFQVNENSVQWLDELYYRILYPLNKTGKNKNITNRNANSSLITMFCRNCSAIPNYYYILSVLSQYSLHWIRVYKRHDNH